MGRKKIQHNVFFVWSVIVLVCPFVFVRAFINEIWVDMKFAASYAWDNSYGAGFDHLASLKEEGE